MKVGEYWTRKILFVVRAATKLRWIIRLQDEIVL